MSKQRILIVENDPILLTGYRKNLLSEGYEVDCQPSAEEVLQAIRVRPPHLILADLELPGMNAIQLLKAVRKDHPHLPYIVLTAFGSLDTKAEATALGVTAYLVKPVPLENLLQMIADHLKAAKRQPPTDTRSITAEETGSPEVLLGSSLRTILDLMGQTLPIKEAFVLVRHPTERALVIREAWGSPRKTLLGRKYLVLGGPEESPDSAIRCQLPLELDPQFEALRGLWSDPRIQYLTLKQGPNLIGILAFRMSEEMDSLLQPGTQVELPKLYGEYLATAIRNANAFDNLLKTHEELKTTQSQLIQQEKLSALGQLAAGIIHDLGNPLTVILGMSEILKSECPKTDPKYKHLALIEQAALSCTGITTNLLNFSRKKSLRAETLNFEDLLRECLSLSRFKLDGTKIRVNCRISQDLPPVHGNKDQLQHVFLNLILNAVQAMGDDEGLLTIWADPIPQGQPCGPGILVAVSDTGPGIPPSALKSIFEPFVTTKPQGVGTGLGLFTVQRTVKEHGGDIKVQNHPGKGCTFSVRLPGVLDQGQVRASAIARKENPIPRILVVDDETGLLQFYEKVLTREGYQVVTARTERESLQHLPQRPDKEPPPFGLLLLDICIGRDSGPHLAAKFRKSYPGIPIVFMTGIPEGEGHLEEWPVGSYALIYKPFDTKKLLEVLHSQLSQMASR